MKTRDDYIAAVLSGFDFAMVESAMSSAGWHWTVDGDNRIPTMVDLIQTARFVMEKAWDGKTFCSTGGFTGVYRGANEEEPALLSLLFTLERYEVDVEEMQS